jgi:hypothetical protein
LDLDSAQAALEQVNKRLDAELAAKSATESRAMRLAGQDTILLSALTVGLLVESYGSHRLPLLAAGATGGLCLFAAVLFAYCSANPRDNGVLPGRLPDELSDDLVAPAMKGPEFIARLMLGLQDVLVQNEINQDRRRRALNRAMLMAGIAVPLAIAVLLVVNALRGTY